jgi:hypothetical protein
MKRIKKKDWMCWKKIQRGWKGKYEEDEEENMKKMKEKKIECVEEKNWSGKDEKVGRMKMKVKVERMKNL